VYALHQRWDAAAVGTRVSLHSRGSRHVGVPLELPRTRNVDKDVVMYIHRGQCLGAVASQPAEQVEHRQLVRPLQAACSMHQLKCGSQSAWAIALAGLPGDRGTCVALEDSNGENEAPRIRTWVEFRHLLAQCLVSRI